MLRTYLLTLAKIEAESVFLRDGCLEFWAGQRLVYGIAAGEWAMIQELQPSTTYHGETPEAAK